MDQSEIEGFDKDWSQVGETLQMLQLAVAQINSAMTDGDESIEHLGTTFSKMAEEFQKVQGLMINLPDSMPENHKQALTGCHLQVGAGIQSAITAFQFYDKLSQRVGNVNHALQLLAELVQDPDRLHEPKAWFDLKEMIQSRYTTREEQIVFETLHEGGSLEEARLKIEKQNKLSDEDDIFF